MARTRVKKRGGASISSDGSVSGIIEPPPFPIVDFIYKWKNWLNNLYQAVSLNVATLWFNITGVDSADTPYTMTIVDQVLLVDPDTADVTINLPDGTVEDGLSFYIKNIDYTGTYVVQLNPGTNNIEQPSGAPSTTDFNLGPLDSVQVIFDSELGTWWII
jgi:hypothetical protein